MLLTEKVFKLLIVILTKFGRPYILFVLMATLSLMLPHMKLNLVQKFFSVFSCSQYFSSDLR